MAGGLQRRVFGLAASQVATDVLADEGVAARNVARWLATQDRLAAGRGLGRGRRLAAGRGRPGRRRRGRDGAHRRPDRRPPARGGRRAKLLLTGDHRQLAAVGAGGAMALLAERRPHVRARRGPPVRRRVGGPGVAAAARRRRDRAARLPQARPARRRRHRRAGRRRGRASLAGRHPRRQAVRRSSSTPTSRPPALSAELRARAGPPRPGRRGRRPAGPAGTTAGVGDLVQARRNAWDLAGFEGNTRAPINRETYRVDRGPRRRRPRRPPAGRRRAITLPARTWPST